MWTILRFHHILLRHPRATDSSDKVINGITYTTQTAYDGLGRPYTVTYPDSSVVTHAYNGPQLASVVEGSTTHISLRGFNPQGQPATATYGNGVTTLYL